jgi:DNA-damage-inducible protein J
LNPALKGAMMQNATINVRLPQDLKLRGDKVLLRENTSISDVVRAVYGYIAQEQKLPDFLKNPKKDEQQILVEQKRRLLQSMVGIIPSSIELEQMKDERLARHTLSGVRE